MHALNQGAWARSVARAVSGAAVEGLVWAAARVQPRVSQPRAPRTVFVLRNNDVGDVLLVTPLLEALRKLFPDCALIVGVGEWARDVLRGNPHVTEVLTVSAPWFNHYSRGRRWPSALGYLLFSPQVRALRLRQAEIGIDVLGSAWGALLLMRAGIPWRMGVRGYSGGHSGAARTIPFAPDVHVARFGLGFAEALGGRSLPAARPQIYLDAAECAAAEALWGACPRPRIVVAPGGGLPQKCWPAERYGAFLPRLAEAGGSVGLLLGPKEDGLKARLAGARCRSFDGLDLRSAFAAIAAADLVITSSSMPLHVAAAFDKPALVLLGTAFTSASAHDRQWGYPGLATSLGQEPGGQDIASVDNACQAVRALLQRAGSSSPR